MKSYLSHQQLGNRISEGAFFFFYGLLRFLPQRLFLAIARPFLRLFIRVAIPRGRVLRNLSAAFGKSYTTASKKGLAKGVQEHFYRNLMDCLLQLSDNGHAAQTIDITGRENLHAALQKGKGVIALGAHIGNFVLLGTRVGLEGHRFHTLFRIPADERIKKLIASFLPRYHQSLIPSMPKRAAVVRILQALRQNEIVYILGDNLKAGSIDALLFGQRVPSPRGPISLALRSESPIVPMYLVRNYHGRMNLIIEPEIELQRTGNLTADIAANTRAMVVYIESLIRAYPDQWNWLTVRMKRQRSQRARASTASETVSAGNSFESRKITEPARKIQF